MERITGQSHVPALHRDNSLPATPVTALSSTHLPASLPPKTLADYTRAVKRRFWLALLIATTIATLGSIQAIRRPDIYQTSAELQINPPQFNPMLASMFGSEMQTRDPETSARYIPTMLASIKGRSLPVRVAEDSSIGGSPVEIAGELGENLVARQQVNTNYVQITLEGKSPDRIVKLLGAIIKVLKEQAGRETAREVDDSKEHAAKSIQQLETDLKSIDAEIQSVVRNSRAIGPGGKSLAEQEYLESKNLLIQELQHINNLKHEAMLYFMKGGSGGGRDAASPIDAKLAALMKLKDTYETRLVTYKETIRDFNNDPAARILASRLKRTLEQIRSLRAMKSREPQISQVIIADAERRAEEYKDEVEASLKRLKDSMPEFQKFQNLSKVYDDVTHRISTLKKQYFNFETLSKTRKDPIVVMAAPGEPLEPIKPKRPMQIALSILLGIAAGVGFVFVLETLDHRVKTPEHVTIGLGIPLLGVVPRARRTALLSRGGHVWTGGVPESIEADAYRNLHASLLGLRGRGRPVVTVLITSAKAGEGKSTTALNLAVTCARAGERTLLVDVDLRRPSLAGVFGADPSESGLVDVLRGDLPWQRTLKHTEVANLDFIPTGNTEGVPIEVLGTLELRRLVQSLSSHYDRVILDGPAILGMADCRMLGRIVDTALLVVKSATHDLSPLRRAVRMLEQSGVDIAGGVFNALDDDLKNWSSVGGMLGYGYHYSSRSSFSTASTRKLGYRPSDVDTTPIAAGAEVSPQAAVAIGERD
jgi:succinoglycan biosynthesis transport protein ExoP